MNMNGRFLFSEVLFVKDGLALCQAFFHIEEILNLYNHHHAAVVALANTIECNEPIVQ